MEISANNILEIAQAKSVVFFSLMTDHADLPLETKLRYRAEARAEIEILLNVVQWSTATDNDKADCRAALLEYHTKIQEYIDVLLPLAKLA